MQKTISNELDALLDVLPPHISQILRRRENNGELLEVILDLGRLPEARYSSHEELLGSREITEQDIEHVTSRVGVFSGDNRAGIERTLHRISAIRNREGRIVGLTCRVGRAVYGTIKIILDLVQSGKSILLLGRPGVGKTTMLREIARVLADDLKKRVIIVDTSNEIAGDGDIPHPAIGHARRMQVPHPSRQHAVMIEAVENHMPEVIIIDEIGTELEAQAARTIAERGVQLVGTAHGNTLDNLVLNPTLSDLVGGIQTVTLGDEEARRRGTQKSVLERKAPPTFDIVVEIQDFNRVAIHHDVSKATDALLRGRRVVAETRWLDENGEIRSERTTPSPPAGEVVGSHMVPLNLKHRTIRLYPFGINRAKLGQAAKETHLEINMVASLKEADLLVTSKNYYHRKPQLVRDAEAGGIPVYVLRSNSLSHMRRLLETMWAPEENTVELAVKEVEEAIEKVKNGAHGIELAPQNSYIRRLQHLMAERYNLASGSTGEEPQRRVWISRSGGES
jgi:stage III sporulation protein SpoIIIAA